MNTPTLPAYETRSHYLTWCDACQRWHWHGKADGHRVAHCAGPESPYWQTGYILRRVGYWTPELRKGGRWAQNPGAEEIVRRAA